MPAHKTIAFKPDERQTEAIEHVHDPMLVVAGAGTGKTTVLTRRVVALIRDGHARPNEILALTYTENAAKEMRQRVQAELSREDLSGLQLCTFHAYCNNLLIRCGKNFGVVDDKDLWIYLRRRIRELNLKYFVRAGNVAQFLDDLLDFIRRCHDELVGPQRYVEFVDRVGCGELPIPRVARSREILSADEVHGRCQEISRVFATVEQMLESENLGTFGHMITRAYELLSSDSVLLESERQHARFILVDEFQDANFAQVKVLQLLAGEQRNVFAVGDPDQAIYRFRGASSAAFGLFRRQFPGTKLVALQKNRRSTTPILRAAYSHISRNPSPMLAGPRGAASYERTPLISARDEECLLSGKPLQSAPVEVVTVTKDAECADVVATIRERQRKTRARWSDFAVLYRMHFHYEELAREFAEQQIPFSVENLDAADTPPVRDLVACVSAVVSTEDGTSLFRVAALPRFSIHPEKLRSAMRSTSRTDTSLAALLRDVENGPAVLDLIDQVAGEIRAKGLVGRAAVEFIGLRFGLDLKSSAVQAFLEFVSTWERKPVTKTRDILALTDYLTYFQEAHGAIPMPASDDDAVRMMTAHAAKGLEFKNVFVIRATAASFPLNYRESLFEFPRDLRDSDSVGEDDNKALYEQEERRLFYVAMTRAQDFLTMYGKQGRGKKDTTPPGYLRELLQDSTVKRYLRPRKANAFQAEIFAATANTQLPSRCSEWLTMPSAFKLDGRLSASSIDTYETCPLQFKLERDWRLPREVSAALHYGKAMHLALLAYYEAVRSGRPMAAEVLVELFRANFAESPISERYQFDLYERQGIQQLETFVAGAQGLPHPEVLHTEASFEIKIGNSVVVGRVDRIDHCEGGVVVTDYKTGKPRSLEDADKSFQLSIYALAAAEKWGYRADRLAFHNLDGNDVVYTTRDERQLQEARLKVEKIAKSISAEEFPPKKGFHCSYCPYRSVCPATEKRLYNSPVANAAGASN